MLQVLLVLLLGISSVVALPSRAFADPDCKQGGYYVLWARGSGEHLNDARARAFRDPLVYGGVLGANVGWGELGNVDGSVVVNENGEPHRYPNATDEYPAVPVGNWNVFNVVNGEYNRSTTIGVNELVAHLNHRYGAQTGPWVSNCHQETLILGGYSQGADVVGWALQRSDLSPAAKDNIGFVALYGDPKFLGNYGQSYNCYQPPWAINIGCFDTVVAGALGARLPYRPAYLQGRFYSFCDRYDGVCNFVDAPMPGSHPNVYQNGLIAGTTNFVASVAKSKRDALNPGLPSSSGAVQPASDPEPPPPIDPPPPPVPWNFENLEGDVGAISPHNANVGRTPAAVEFNGQFYVFHYDATNGDLRYARTTPGWVFDILDGAGGPNNRTTSNVGQAPTAVVYNNQLHVFYYDAGDGNLRHATSSDGVYWNFENLDGDWGSVGHLDGNVGQTPAATVYGGSLQLFYYDAGRGNLRHAWLSGGSWYFENLEGDPGSISHYDTNIGVDPTVTVHNGTLQVFYSDVTAGNLRHAWADGAGWHFENLDGDLGSVGGLNADVGGNPTSVVYSGNLHVFYYDRTNGNLRHMWSDPWNGWHDEDLDGSFTALTGYDGDVGSMSSAVVVGNTLQLFVYEAGRGNLRHLFDDGTGWKWENLDGQGGVPAGRLHANVGLDPVATTFGGGLQVYYFDHDNGNLRHAMPQ